MSRDYRAESIQATLEEQWEPACIGNCGGYPLWVWFGNSYLFLKWTLQERHPRAFLPHVAYPLLDGYTSSRDTYRSYHSKELALEALERVRQTLRATAQPEYQI